MEKHCAKIKAVYKSRMEVEVSMDYIIYNQENSSNYRELLINKIKELDSRIPGLIHLEVWENGFLLNIFRLAKSPSDSEFKNWNEIIEALKIPDSF